MKWTFIAAVLFASVASAQDAPTDAAAHQHGQPVANTWAWRADGSAFLGYNYQYRKFRDFDEFESQNWVMGTGSRTIGRTRLQLSTMLSFEPLTLADLGSPILDAGYHPIGTSHTHRKSPVGALTVGYINDLVRGRYGMFGVGGDVTGYVTANNLRDSYGSPWSFHLFVRYRTRPTGAMTHVH